MLVAATVLPVQAETARPRPPTVAPGSLAAYAPSDCDLFIQIERPERINPHLRNANAWHLLQLLLGVEWPAPTASTDWYDVLAANLAGEAGDAMRALFSERVALTAPAWTRLRDGVILFQVRSRKALYQHLLSPDMIESEERAEGLPIYRSKGGLRIATDGRTVVLARTGADPRWFAQCVALLAGRRTDSLAQVPAFARRARELPRRRLPPEGFVYFRAAEGAPVVLRPDAAERATASSADHAGADTEPAASPERSVPETSDDQNGAEGPGATSTATQPAEHPRGAPDGPSPGATADATRGLGLWPPLRAGVVGLYASGNRVDILVRASRVSPRVGLTPRVDVRRLKRLPRSTLLAWAGFMDTDAAFARFLEAPADSPWAPLASFLTETAAPETLTRSIVSKIGPRMMVVWGHDFVVEGGRSSLAVLFESADAESVKNALDGVVVSMVKGVNERWAGATDRRLHTSTMQLYGTEVTVVELADYFTGTAPPGLVPRLLSTMRLCYAALDNWVWVAWDVDQMRELIAAHNGLEPGLDEFPDVARLRSLRTGPATLAVGQLATAAAVLGTWLDRVEREPALFDDLLGNTAGKADPGAENHLGLRWGPANQPGRVPVGWVAPAGQCGGLIAPGDDILAVNGQILDLQDTLADLEDRIRRGAGERPIIFRVERDGMMFDVPLHVTRPRKPTERVITDALRALRRLQLLCRHLAFATLAESRSDPAAYHAHLRLRLSEPK